MCTLGKHQDDVGKVELPGEVRKGRSSNKKTARNSDNDMI